MQYRDLADKVQYTKKVFLASGEVFAWDGVEVHRSGHCFLEIGGGREFGVRHYEGDGRGGYVVEEEGRREEEEVDAK